MKKTTLCCICASVPLTIISGTQAAPLSREISNLSAPAYIIQAYCYQQCSYPGGDPSAWYRQQCCPFDRAPY